MSTSWKSGGAVGLRQDLLGLQELSEAQAQDGPILLLDGEVAPEVEDGDLAHAPTNASASHQAGGETGLAGDFVAGLPCPLPVSVLIIRSPVSQGQSFAQRLQF